MTELEEKAKEYAIKNRPTDDLCSFSEIMSNEGMFLGLKKGYKDGYAQGQQAKSLEVICKDCSIQKQISKQCDDLLKENAELKAQNEILVKDLQTAIDTNRQWLKRDTALEAQIEKMKCCGNCKYNTNRGIRNCSKETDEMYENNHMCIRGGSSHITNDDYWELAE